MVASMRGWGPGPSRDAAPPRRSAWADPTPEGTPRSTPPEPAHRHRSAPLTGHPHPRLAPTPFADRWRDYRKPLRAVKGLFDRRGVDYGLEHLGRKWSVTRLVERRVPVHRTQRRM